MKDIIIGDMYAFAYKFDKGEIRIPFFRYDYKHDADGVVATIVNKRNAKLCFSKGNKTVRKVGGIYLILNRRMEDHDYTNSVIDFKSRMIYTNEVFKGMQSDHEYMEMKHQIYKNVKDRVSEYCGINDLHIKKANRLSLEIDFIGSSEQVTDNISTETLVLILRLYDRLIFLGRTDPLHCPDGYKGGKIKFILQNKADILDKTKYRSTYGEKILDNLRIAIEFYESCIKANSEIEADLVVFRSSLRTYRVKGVELNSIDDYNMLKLSEVQHKVTLHTNTLCVDTIMQHIKETTI